MKDSRDKVENSEHNEHNERARKGNAVWDVSKRTGLRLGRDERIRVLSDGEVVVEHFVVERDVTEECRVELRKSGSSSGYYCCLLHGSVSIGVLGLDENGKAILTKNGYRMEKSPDGHVSFRVKTTRTY